MEYIRDEVIENVVLLTKEEDLALITLLVKKAEKTTLDYIRRDETFLHQVSDIVEDIAVYKYNLLGREGISSESLGGNSISINESLPRTILDRLNNPKFRINTVRFL